MTKILKEHVFWTASTELGTYVAYSNQSPLFFFEAESEQAVEEKVKSALNFYTESEGSIREAAQVANRRLVTTSRSRRNVFQPEAA